MNSGFSRGESRTAELVDCDLMSCGDVARFSGVVLESELREISGPLEMVGGHVTVVITMARTFSTHGNLQNLNTWS